MLAGISECNGLKGNAEGGSDGGLQRRYKSKDTRNDTISQAWIRISVPEGHGHSSGNKDSREPFQAGA